MKEKVKFGFIDILKEVNEMSPNHKGIYKELPMALNILIFMMKKSVKCHYFSHGTVKSIKYQVYEASD